MTDQKQIKTTSYKSPVGELILGDFRGEICLCDWRFRKMRPNIDKRIQGSLGAPYHSETTELLKETSRQLDAYFKRDLKVFNLPLNLVGSDFQKQIWNELLKIPYGSTSNYTVLSEAYGDIKAIRAVASANGANAISIIVPCHRVVGSDGSLTGYAGGLPAKKKLLELEDALPGKEQLQLF